MSRREDITTLFRYAFDVERGRAKYATIRERITEGARIDGIHLCQLIAAMIIASVGLNTNSTEAVIGAMLICPLMGSVIACACGIATMDMRMVHRSLTVFAMQCGLCLVTSTAYFLISPLATQTSELLTNSTGTIWDVIIALVGGFAGALGLSRRQEPSTLLAGVAVATALMPPLCSVGFGFATRDGMLALSALYKFLVNAVFIAFGSAVVFVWLKMPLVGDLHGDGKETAEDRVEAERESHVLRRYLVAGLVVFAIPCLFYSMQVIQRSVAENGTVFQTVDAHDTKRVTKELRVICPGFVSYRIGVEDTYEISKDALVQRMVATVVTTNELTSATKLQIEGLIHLNVADVDEVVFEVSTEELPIDQDDS